MSTFSRQQALCGHCGMKVIRHNLIAHTKNVHPGEKPKEKAHKMKTLDLMMMPPSKKTKVDNATEHAESDAENDIENVNTDIIEPESPTVKENNEVMNKLKQIENNVKISFDELKQDIKDLKKERKGEEATNKDVENFENGALDNARTVCSVIDLLSLL